MRSIIELESDTGVVGLGESYGDAAFLRLAQALQPTLEGLDPFNLNGLRERVLATVTAAPRRAGANPCAVRLVFGVSQQGSVVV